MKLKGTPLRSGRVKHLKRCFSKTCIFFLPTYLVYQNLFCGTLICVWSIWHLGLKTECIFLTLLTFFWDQQIKYKLKWIANRKTIYKGTTNYIVDCYALYTTTTRIKQTDVWKKILLNNSIFTVQTENKRYYRIVIEHLFCNKYKPFQRLFL